MDAKTTTVKFWNTRTLTEETVIYGYISPTKEKPTRVIYDHLTPLNDQSDPKYRYAFSWLYRHKQPTPLIQPLKLPYLKLKTRNDKGLNARRKWCCVYKGRVKIRYATEKETPIPTIETYPFSDQVIYKFYYYCTITQNRRVKTVKSNKNYKRNTPTTTYIDQLLKKHKRYMILYRLTARSKIDGITLILYELKLKQQYAIPHKEKPFTPRRSDHKPLITINYAKLMKYEKRVSKKWFKQLLNALQTEDPYALKQLPQQLQKIAKKVITQQHITPTLRVIRKWT